MFTANSMGRFEHQIERAVALALFIPLIISSGGNSGSEATSLIIRALAIRQITLRDWWQVAAREIPSGLALGAILGVVGAGRIMLWQVMGWYDYGEHGWLIALTVGLALSAWSPSARSPARCCPSRSSAWGSTLPVPRRHSSPRSSMSPEL
jgi:magnesium transporter